MTSENSRSPLGQEGTERLVAQVICKAMGQEPAAWATEGGVSQANWKFFLEPARAAIAVMQRRLDDCEMSLRIFDESGSSEYWERYK